MKKLIFLSLILINNACVDQASNNIDFTMFNRTDKTVKVLGFVRDFDNPEKSTKAKPIAINPNSQFKVTRVTGIEGNTHMRFYSLSNGGVDSVRVIFNNEKVLAVTLEGTYKQGQTIFQGDDNYQHFITEQDYNDAKACNGDCE